MEQKFISFELQENEVEKIMLYYKEYQIDSLAEYVIFCAKTNSKVIVQIYHSKKGYKIVFSGENPLQEASKWKQNVSLNTPKQKLESEWIYLDNQIGSDEVGTGDFFGPVIVCASYVSKEIIPYLKEIGVDDSKKLDDKKILEIVPKILPKVIYSKLTCSNEKYNEMISKGHNMNSIKALLHNQALLNVSKKIKEKKVCFFVDQFCEPYLYYRYITNQKEILNTITFRTKGESYYPSVAVSSLIARYSFIKFFNDLDEHYHMHFLKGASSKVDDFAALFVQKYGIDELNKLIKKNFSNYSKIKK